MKAISVQFAELKRVTKELRAIMGRTDDARKKDLVEARRALIDQFSRLGETVQQRSVSSGVDPAFVSEFTKRLAEVRTTTARFQAEWPAVSIDDNPERYAREATVVNETLHRFIEWGFGQAGRLE